VLGTRPGLSTPVCLRVRRPLNAKLAIDGRTGIIGTITPDSRQFLSAGMARQRALYDGTRSVVKTDVTQAANFAWRLQERASEQTPWHLVRERTILTERAPLVDEI
jgi:hypothetical protein